MFCGFTDAIEVFDVSAPGEGVRLFTRPTKKSKDGLRGMFPPPPAVYLSNAPNRHYIFFSLLPRLFRAICGGHVLILDRSAL